MSLCCSVRCFHSAARIGFDGVDHGLEALVQLVSLGAELGLHGEVEVPQERHAKEDPGEEEGDEDGIPGDATDEEAENQTEDEGDQRHREARQGVSVLLHLLLLLGADVLTRLVRFPNRTPLCLICQR